MNRLQREWESLSPEQRAEIRQRVRESLANCAEEFKALGRNFDAANRLLAPIMAEFRKFQPIRKRGSGSFTGRGRLAP